MKYILSILSLAALFSCQKVSYDCDIWINSRVEEVQGEPVKVLEDVVAYAFYGDTVDYKINDYAQAVSGHITTSKEEQTRPFDVKGVYDSASGQIIFESLSKPIAVIVVCDTKNEVFGYYQQSIAKGLDLIQVTFMSTPWSFADDPTKTLVVGSWRYRK